MNKQLTTAGIALALGLVWTAGPALAQTTGEKIENKAEKAGDKAESTMDEVKDKARELKDKAKAKLDKAGDKNDVSAMQQALKDEGHDPGPIDGVFGPRTRAALREYQKKEGLTATGRWDDATRAKLGVTTTGGSASPQTGTGGSAPLTGDTKGGSSTPTNMPASPEPDKQPEPKRQQP